METPALRQKKGIHDEWMPVSGDCAAITSFRKPSRTELNRPCIKPRLSQPGSKPWLNPGSKPRQHHTP